MVLHQKRIQNLVDHLRQNFFFFFLTTEISYFGKKLHFRVLNTPLFTYSYIQLSRIFTITVLIAKSTLKHINSTRSNIFGNSIFELKGVPNVVLFLDTTCSLQQLRTFANDSFNLVLGCKIIEPRYVITRTKGFFSTVRE